MVQLEKLPDKWAIKRTVENYKIVNKWFNENSQSPCKEYTVSVDFLLYPAINSFHQYRRIKEGYTEITFDEFKKFVLKEKIKFEVGKWYKSDCSSKYYSKIIKIEAGNVICECITDGEYSATTSFHQNSYIVEMAILLTDLSEIQQYLPENHPDKKEEDWIPKVGDYVFLKDCGCFIYTQTGFEKNNIYKLQDGPNGRYYYTFYLNGIQKIGFHKHEVSRYLRKALPHEIPSEKVENMIEYIVREWPSGTLTMGCKHGKYFESLEDYEFEGGVSKNSIYGHWNNSYAGKLYKEATKEQIDYFLKYNTLINFKSKEEDINYLLSEAKRRYPVGTKFLSPENNKIFTVEPRVGTSLYYESSYGKNISCHTKERYGEFLLYNNKWAEIIENEREEIYFPQGIMDRVPKNLDTFQEPILINTNNKRKSKLIV